MAQGATIYEVRDVQPKLEPFEEAYFSVRLETHRGEIELRIKESALKLFDDEIERELKLKSRQA
jgi:hypothetical protein